MTDTTLPHAIDDCPGDFVQHGERGTGAWRCPVCGVEYPSTPENDRKADREWAIGKRAQNAAWWHRVRDLLAKMGPQRPPPVIDLTPPEEPREPWQG